MSSTAQDQSDFDHVKIQIEIIKSNLGKMRNKLNSSSSEVRQMAEREHANETKKLNEYKRSHPEHFF